MRRWAVVLGAGLSCFAVAGYFYDLVAEGRSGFFWGSAIPGIMLVLAAALEALSGRRRLDLTD